MMRREFGSVLPRLFRHCRDICDAARGRARKDHGGYVHSRAGGQRLRRFLARAWQFSGGSYGPLHRGRGLADRAVPHRNSRESLVDHPGWRLPTGCRASPHREVAESGDDPEQLRVSDRHLVMADGDTAGMRGLGAPKATGEWDYRSRLEAFFEAAGVPHSIIAADRLTARYRTVAELLSADPAMVAEDAGSAAAAAIARARGLMLHAAGDELRKREPLTRTRVAHFLKSIIGFRCDECLVVLFLDARHGLIDHEILAVGRPDSVEFDLRRIVLHAIGRGATGIIIAHNHPSGDPQPSSSDFRVTRQLADTARGLGISLHDHLVIAGGEVRSAMFTGGC
jgi:DNA repair protein RadC